MRSIVLAAVAALTLAACGDAESPEAGADDAGDSLQVSAGFYPLEFVVGRVGGDRVSVTNLTPLGAEPHHLELSPRDIADLGQADLVVYLAGFSPALDDAVHDSARAFDVTEAAHLEEHAEEEHADEEHADEQHADEEHADEEHAEEEHADEEHADEEHADEDEHDHGAADPHFWLDPTKLADVADAVAEQLAALAPDSAEQFTANAAALRADLETLDGEFADGLADCDTHHLVTSHAAFSYLAERYGLEQIGITGLSPEEAPSPAKLAEVTEFVDEHDVTTIFYETLVDPAIADTVAAETGAATAVLDPLEGLTEQAADTDYLDVMRANLDSLRAGLGCR